jgi:hypothetical protein
VILYDNDYCHIKSRERVIPLSYTAQYDGIFQQVGQQYGFDPLLLKTIAIKESGINPNVPDNKNSNGTIDVGMMQINSADREYAKYGYSTLKNDPYTCVVAAAETLQEKVRILQSKGMTVNTYNLLWAYNGLSAQGQRYANSAYDIYKNISNGVDISPYQTNGAVQTSLNGTNDSNSAFNNITIPSSNYGIVANSQKFGNILYGRRYRVIVSNANGVALDVSQLRCTFKIQKSILQPLNISEIVIYNLDAETENSIIQEGNRVVVEAGYEGEQYGLIFDGDLIQPIRDKEDSVNYRLTLNSLDGDRPMNFGFVNFSMVKGQTSRSQIENIVSRATIPSQLGNISDAFTDTQLSRGKVVFGLARDYLRQLAKTQEATFYVEDGKVNIIKAEDLPDGEIFDLTPSSGLLNIPAQNEYGVLFRCLLNPRIKINSLVHIDNSLIRAQQFQFGQSTPLRSLDNDGIYRVIGITYLGDTRGDEWYAECQTVSQAGLMPSMAPTPNANPFS